MSKNKKGKKQPIQESPEIIDETVDGLTFSIEIQESPEIIDETVDGLTLSIENDKDSRIVKVNISEPHFENQKIPAPQVKRRNSRILLEETKDESSPKVLYRPEFVNKSMEKQAQEKIWELMSSYIGSDQKSIQRSVINHVEYTLARTRFNFDNLGAYQATGYSIRDRLIEAWNDT